MSEAVRPLEGKVAVITGASSGIGKAAAASWAAMGADLVVCARSDAPRADGFPSLVDTKEAVEALGRRCVTVRVDVSKEEDIAELGAQTREAFGRVDIVFNNAAVLESSLMNSSFFDMTPDSWRYQVAVNLTGPWLVMKALVPSMVDRGGMVVNMTSGPVPGSTPNPYLPGHGAPGAAYPVTKAGINRMSEVLAKELRPYGISVVTLHPGKVMVERSEHRLRDAGYDLSLWGSIDYPIAALNWLVTHDDPMSLSGSLQHTPKVVADHGLL